MKRKILFTGAIVVLAAGVAYSQLAGLMGWNKDPGGTTDAGMLGRNVGKEKISKPDRGITLDNGLKNSPTVVISDD